jgi:hypothetical protein
MPTNVFYNDYGLRSFMKKIIMSVLLIGLSSSPLLFGVCKNNPGGGGKDVHVKAIGKKKKKNYICSNKSREQYEAKKGGKIFADRFYTGNVCKKCGCTSAEHVDK